MKRTHLDTACLVILCLIFGVAVGYFWRMEHESVKVARIAEASQEVMIQTIFDEAKNGRIFWYGDSLRVIPRRDGRITIERSE